ncbi:substrate-binding domain-containing protein [Nakamurella sp. A5-74]|uniref:Substrate-binding domain-containing protein n=1 Tax=Nakamurella sp. A5-74 TaxID=3158264 RepID=A0AAU8DRL9_9ACTN
MSIRFVRLTAAVAIGLGLVGLAGCGSDTNTTSPAGTGSAVTGSSAPATGSSAPATGSSAPATGSSDAPTNSSGGGAVSGKKIALLLPESKTARYEAFDRPLFEADIKAKCGDCEVLYSNADQDAAKQQQQAEAALTQGADVLVLDPVDGTAAASVVAASKAKGVPVVAYDRFIAGADFYVSFDNETVGKLQAQTLVDLLKAGGKTAGSIVMVNGSPTDPNAASFKKGAHGVLDGSGYTIAAEYDTPDWSPDKAQTWMDGQVIKVKADLVGVYAANDGTASGVIASLRAGGVNPVPPVTGQDAELPAIQRILTGDQAMTVYKPIKPEAAAAADAALALAGDSKPTSTTDTEGVPSTILDPIAVTKDKIKDTVVKDGFYTAAQICTGAAAAACTAAGIG